MNNLLEEEELIAWFVCMVLMMFPNGVLACSYWLSVTTTSTVHTRDDKKQTFGKTNRKPSLSLPSLELLEEEDHDDDDSRSNCHDSYRDYDDDDDDAILEVGGGNNSNNSISRHNSTNSSSASTNSLLSNDIFDEADSIELTRKRLPPREIICEINEGAFEEKEEQGVDVEQSKVGGTVTPNTSTLTTMTDTKSTLHNDNIQRMERITARIKPKLLYRRICCSTTAMGRVLPITPLTYGRTKYNTNQQTPQHRMRGSKTSTSIINNNKHNSRRSSKTFVIVVSFGEDTK